MFEVDIYKLSYRYIFLFENYLKFPRIGVGVALRPFHLFLRLAHSALRKEDFRLVKFFWFMRWLVGYYPKIYYGDGKVGQRNFTSVCVKFPFMNSFFFLLRFYSMCQLVVSKNLRFKLSSNWDDFLVVLHELGEYDFPVRFDFLDWGIPLEIFFSMRHSLKEFDKGVFFPVFFSFYKIMRVIYFL
jgi:hypothetical protein